MTTETIDKLYLELSQISCAVTAREKKLISQLKFLWNLLDEIDTASDMFKPEDSKYCQYVRLQHEKRFFIATSDGFNLFDAGTGEKL